ncbi:DUF6171 family protein [uncultured Ruminococcus sp.]|uniref:DUF6171 family protein n=1 Tax=uncultured Ruminococcus sp. TaxID=165186 RepID=UPI0025D438DA|nr:DUF6171 family protein [uncultured Ruminococcus sp.]
MDRPICKRCLLSETDLGDTHRKIVEMVEAMPSEKRVGKEEYERRLRKCEECTELGQGMCGLCGCFVQLRAAKKDKHCPHPTPYW